MNHLVMVLGPAIAIVAVIRGQAKADVTYILTDTKNNVSAQAVFSIVNVNGTNELKVAVTNTESNTADASQAIGQIQFTVGGNVGLPGSSDFRELKGTMNDFAGTTKSVDDLSPGDSEHWNYGSSGSTVSLWTVNAGSLTGGYGGKPNYLIAAAGSTPNASLKGNHAPSFVGETDYYFTDSKLPSNGDLKLTDITGVKFGFGTNGEVALEGSTSSSYTPALTPRVVAPEPSSMAMTVVISGMVGAFAAARRHPSRPRA